MSVSVDTLALAINALVIKRLLVAARIDSVSPDVDEEEHLSETVIDIGKALLELGDLYIPIAPKNYGFERICAEAEQEFWAMHPPQ